MKLRCLITTYALIPPCHTPTPYYRQVCRPLHINPQPLPLTTRNSCEAKPCCLLKPPIKIFLLFFNIGFGKILAAEKFRQHNGCILDNSKSCIHPIYTISKYMATSIPSHAYNTKLCTYICSIIHNQSLFLT